MSVTSACVLAQKRIVFTLWVSVIWLCTYLLHFALADTLLKHELSRENKAVDCPEPLQILCSHRHPAPTFVPEYKVETKYSVTATVPEFSSVGTWQKGVFTLVSNEYRTRASCPGTKCEHCLIQWGWEKEAVPESCQAYVHSGQTAFPSANIRLLVIDKLMEVIELV